MGNARLSNGLINLNGNKYEISSWDLKYVSKHVPFSLYHDAEPKKFEVFKIADNKMETNIEYVCSWDLNIPISPMLTEEDREKIIEEAKIRCAVSWLEV